jgi:hypothetical protein
MTWLFSFFFVTIPPSFKAAKISANLFGSGKRGAGFEESADSDPFEEGLYSESLLNMRQKEGVSTDWPVGDLFLDPTLVFGRPTPESAA